jgi:thiol-disulfide isomerase/thioredoxin
MMKSAPFVLLSLTLVSIVSMASYLLYRSQALEAEKKVEELTHLPNFSFKDLAGKTRSRSEWAGKVLVINFWATWCPPCLKEIPVFIELQKAYAKRGLQFVGIGLNNNYQTVQGFVDDVGINYPILSGENAPEFALSLGNYYAGLPFTVVVDRQNRIVVRHLGDLNRQEIEEMVLPLLGGEGKL